MLEWFVAGLMRHLAGLAFSGAIVLVAIPTDAGEVTGYDHRRAHTARRAPHRRAAYRVADGEAITSALNPRGWCGWLALALAGSDSMRFQISPPSSAVSRDLRRVTRAPPQRHYPERAEATKRGVPGRKSPGCPAAVFAQAR